MRFQKVTLVLSIVIAAAGIVYADATVAKNDGFVDATLWGKGGIVAVNCTNEVGPDGSTTNANCHGQIPAGQEPARAFSASGFLCGTDVGLTTDTNLVATPSGQVNFTCKIH